MNSHLQCGMVCAGVAVAIFASQVNAAASIPGHERELRVPRINSSNELVVSPPQIDGVLDDQAWQLANEQNSFWCSLTDIPPPDQTDVLVIMDDEYLYFGFRLYDDEPEKIQSARLVRDVGLGYDDSIKIELDTFFNRRDISSFSLNPVGTQNDEIAGGRSSKIEWKGDWLGAAVRSDYGWSAEFAIPFAILNYNDDLTRFGVNFVRYQNRTNEYSYWADVTPQKYNEEMGQLTGLVLPSANDKKTWTFMPFVLAGKHIPNKRGDIKDYLVTSGIDIRYQPRSDLTGLVALNPDFSQVEDAVTDISFSYSEKAVADNRPFFVEGSDYLSTEYDDNEYFYSNNIPDFNAGIKGFGRFGKTQFGILATEAPEDRYDFVGRALYEIDETNSATAMLISSEQPDFNNQFVLVQFRGRQAYGLNYSFDAAYTDTNNLSDPGYPKGDGDHVKGSLGWDWEHVTLGGSIDRYDKNYFPADALLDSDLPGTRGISLKAGYYQELSHPVWSVIDAYVGTNYRETNYGAQQQRKIFGSGSVEFSNEIRLTASAVVGPYRPVTDDPGIFKTRKNDDRVYSLATDFNVRSNYYSGGFQHDWGDLGGGPYKYYAAYGWWRPVTPVYLKLSAERVDSFGTNDQLVLVGSWNINPEHSLAGRYIYTDDISYYRLAYGHRARKGIDIFAVYDDNSIDDAAISIKLVITF